MAGTKRSLGWARRKWRWLLGAAFALYIIGPVPILEREVQTVTTYQPAQPLYDCPPNATTYAQCRTYTAPPTALAP